MAKQGDRISLLATSLASNLGAGHTDEAPLHETPTSGHFKVVTSSMTLVFALSLVVFSVLDLEKLSDNPERAALKILEKPPIIRVQLAGMGCQVDIPRLRAGKAGGFFWSVYVECGDSGSDFMSPTDRVRDTLEQIDTFKLATSILEMEATMRIGKIASSIGIEGQAITLNAGPRLNFWEDDPGSCCVSERWRDGSGKGIRGGILNSPRSAWAKIARAISPPVLRATQDDYERVCDTHPDNVRTDAKNPNPSTRANIEDEK
ncbi:hypothetical protein BDV93DRAFT_583846 [Ceratobasidium sp. AG-I]|nr:hypothetical protein BDV93DRAFT_583846 [Ceratobasidium sp. AG-I]